MLNQSKWFSMNFKSISNKQMKEEKKNELMFKLPQS